MIYSPCREYIRNHQDNVESIKLSFAYISYETMSLREVVISSVSWVYNYYLATKNKQLLYKGLLVIEAYLQSGFPYEYGAEHFDRILSSLDTSREQVFPSAYYNAAKIKLAKATIGRIFYNWKSPSKNGKTKSQIIDEIINKVKNHDQGVYTYYNNYGNVYVLVINEVECYIHDQTRHLFFTFEDKL